MTKELKSIIIVFTVLSVTAFILSEKKETKHSDMMMSFEDFDQIIGTEIPYIKALDLAKLIKEQKEHYRLIDLRSDSNYKTYHIPSAENFSPEQFLDHDTKINEYIVLYSNYDARSLKLYYLLNIRGYFNVRILFGGIKDWESEILFPDINKISDSSKEARKSITDFFGGSFQSDQLGKKILKKINIDKKFKEKEGC